MKTRNLFTRSLALMAMSLGVVIIAAFWPSGRVAAIGNPDIRPEFGLLSLASGQTARLSVANPVLIAPPEPDAPARRVQIAFDIYGISDPNDSPDPISPDDTLRLTHLRFLARQSRVVRLKPGEAASLDFVASADGTYISAVMVGDVEHSPDPNRRAQPDIVPTLEVMQGGRTLFTHPALVKLFNPQPDPPGARKTPGI